MPETTTFLADRLITEGQKTVQFFQEINPPDWNVAIYTEGENWSPKQILAHFLATETSLCDLLENILAGGEGSPADFDINQFNQEKVDQLGSLPVEQMISLFQENRAKTTLLVTQLSDSDLEIQGRHPFLGVTPVSDIIKIIYRHNQIHQREMRTALKPDRGSV